MLNAGQSIYIRRGGALEYWRERVIYFGPYDELLLEPCNSSRARSSIATLSEALAVSFGFTGNVRSCERTASYLLTKFSEAVLAKESRNPKTWGKYPQLYVWVCSRLEFSAKALSITRVCLPLCLETAFTVYGIGFMSFSATHFHADVLVVCTCFSVHSTGTALTANIKYCKSYNAHKTQTHQSPSATLSTHHKPIQKPYLI